MPASLAEVAEAPLSFGPARHCIPGIIFRIGLGLMQFDFSVRQKQSLLFIRYQLPLNSRGTSDTPCITQTMQRQPGKALLITVEKVPLRQWTFHAIGQATHGLL